MALVRCTCIVAEVVAGQRVEPVVPDADCGYIIHRLQAEEVPCS
jgi:hypothetical protein